MQQIDALQQPTVQLLREVKEKVKVVSEAAAIGRDSSGSVGIREGRVCESACVCGVGATG